MEPLLQQEEGPRLTMEAEVEEDPELDLGLQRRKPPRPTKNVLHTAPLSFFTDDDAHHLYSQSSDSSIITYEELEPELSEEVRFNSELVKVNNGGHRNGGSIAVAEEAAGIYAEEEKEGEGLQKSFSFKDESGTKFTQENQTTEYKKVEIFVSETTADLVHEEYDLTVRKSGTQEVSSSQKFDDIANSTVEIAVPNKDQIYEQRGLEAKQLESQEVPSTQSNHQTLGISVDEICCDLVYPAKSYQGATDFGDLIDERRKNLEVDRIEEVDTEETEFDVEKLVKKQNTHDLICPNCHSCITRSVILRKKIKVRKPPARRPRPDPKANATSVSAANIGSNEVITPVVTAPDAPSSYSNNIREPEPKVFRCLSCFSFFIPTGSGFKIFNFFGDKSKTLKVPDSEEEAPTQTTPSIPAESNVTDRGLVTEEAEEASAVSEDMTNSVKNSSSTVMGRYDGDEPVNDSGRSPDASTKPQPAEITIILAVDQVENYQRSAGGIAKDLPAENGHSIGTEVPLLQVQSSPTEPQKIVVGSNLPVKVIEDKSKIWRINDAGKKPEDATAKSTGDVVQAISNPAVIDIDRMSSGGLATYIPANNDQSRGEEVPSLQAQSPADISQNVVIDSIMPIEGKEEDQIVFGRKSEDNAGKSQDNAGVVIVIDRTPIPPTSEDEVTQIAVVAQATADEQQSIEARESSDIDILKSLVYGGLIESIASLSVVSSAAGAGAATLNTFALALANLVGGLFVLAHNLKELKNESSETTSGTDTQVDRYYTVLGRRGRFSLHATIAVLSYLIFGLVAPITYGFSFRESDNQDYKLAAVAAVSLFCILLLALGKARVKEPPRSYGLYVKTAFEYLGWGVGASGVSFLAGQLLNKLLEKLGWLDSTTSVAAALTELTLPGSGWASY